MKHMTRQEFVAAIRRYIYNKRFYFKPKDKSWSIIKLALEIEQELSLSLMFSNSICRKSSGFSRGASMYRGVTR